MLLSYLVKLENDNCCRFQRHLCMWDLRIHLGQFYGHLIAQIWILMTARSGKHCGSDQKRIHDVSELQKWQSRQTEMFHGLHCIKWLRHIINVFTYLVAFFMVALCNRADHIYFHPVSSSFFFFPRLISAVGDWMSTILRHMVWS